MIDKKQLTRAKCGYRPTPGGLGFGQQPALRTYTPPRVLLVDPGAVEGLFTVKETSTFPHYLRASGIAIRDIGRDREGPVWWKEPYLVWAVSAHRSSAEKATPPEGWKVVAENLRSESGVVVLSRYSATSFVKPACDKLCAAERACRIAKVPSGLWQPFFHQHHAKGVPASDTHDVVFICKADPVRKAPGPWDIAFDLRDVRNRDDFFRILAKHLEIKRRKPESWFWNGFSDKANSHRGDVNIRFTGWESFERRHKKLALLWRRRMRDFQTSWEVHNVKPHYDVNPTGEPIPTRLRQVMLAKGCTLTLAALAIALRENKTPWRVDADNTGLRISRGDWIACIGPLKDPETRSFLRDINNVDQFVENHDDEDIRVIAAAPKILQVATAHPKAREPKFAKLWNAVNDTIRKFPKAYLADEEFEAPE